MAKNGFKIFDSDTHVGPAANVLERYLSQSEKQKLQNWEKYKFVNPLNGDVEYTFGRRKYLRKLGSAGPEPDRRRTSRDVADRKYPDDLPLPKAEVDPAERIKDMDREGVDVNLTLPSSWFGTFTAGDDIELEAG